MGKTNSPKTKENHPWTLDKKLEKQTLDASQDIEPNHVIRDKIKTWRTKKHTKPNRDNNKVPKEKQDKRTNPKYTIPPRGHERVDSTQVSSYLKNVFASSAVLYLTS